MKLWKRASALLVSAALVSSLLAACGAPKVDPVQEALGYPGSTVFATINGDKITAGEYLVWLASYIDNVNSNYQMMGAAGIDWAQDLGDGSTPKDFVKTQTLEHVKMLWAIENTAKTEGVKNNAEDQKAYEEERSAAIEQLGGEEEYAVYLKSMLLTEAQMEKITKTSALSEKIEAALAREGGRFEATKEIVGKYMEEQGIFKAKHILYSTVDAALDNAPYSPEKVAAQKQKAEAALAQIRAAEDPIATFDTLMQEQSEDPGLQTQPDGYLFSTKPDGVDFSSRMVEEFEAGTQALAYNGVSELIKSSFGYHIILRLDPTDDTETYEKYRDRWEGTQIDTVYQEALDKAEVKTTEAYDAVDAEDFYSKLTAYRTEVEKTMPKEEAQTPPEDEDATTPEGEGTTPEGGTTPPDDATTPEGGTPTDGTAPPADGTEVPESTPPADGTEAPEGTTPADGTEAPAA